MVTNGFDFCLKALFSEGIRQGCFTPYLEIPYVYKLLSMSFSLIISNTTLFLIHDTENCLQYLHVCWIGLGGHVSDTISNRKIIFASLAPSSTSLVDYANICDYNAGLSTRR